jgi:hypothetical protein
MINTAKFTDWPRLPAATMQRFRMSSPNLVKIQEHCTTSWQGTTGLGIWGVRRMRGSATVWSVHSWGAALDLSWRGLPRSVAVEICDWLVEHSADLGIQAVHDYGGCRIWRSVRVGARAGWQQQAIDAEGMGQPWGDWLHIEVTEDAWADSRPVPLRIGSVRPVLRRGATGPAVLALQQIMAEKAGQPIGRPDGQFGPRTLSAWRNVAAFAKLPADDAVQAGDWDVLAWIDGGWGRLNAAGVS